MKICIPHVDKNGKDTSSGDGKPWQGCLYGFSINFSSTELAKH